MADPQALAHRIVFVGAFGPDPGAISAACGCGAFRDIRQAGPHETIAAYATLVRQVILAAYRHLQETSGH